MIRIELDRIHLELLLLSGLFAALSGVVFQPNLRYGINIVPLGTFAGVAVIGIVALLLRRFTGWDPARLRSMIWFGLFGGFAGAMISRVAVGSTEKMLFGTVGGAAMAMALAVGMKVTVVIKSQDDAAREAVDRILEQKNVYTATEQFEANTSRSSEAKPQTDDDGNWGSTTDGGETEDDTLEATDDPGSESWVEEEADSGPIPVIRSISDSTEK
ncbi:hypothetical protein [Halocatena halophila]|uniref:hypothetical protein n=1 Tax=Halocatena halophila TaxID=2814576 RepID=UPI002ED09E31